MWNFGLYGFCGSWDVDDVELHEFSFEFSCCWLFDGFIEDDVVEVEDDEFSPFIWPISIIIIGDGTRFV